MDNYRQLKVMEDMGGLLIQNKILQAKLKRGEGDRAEIQKEMNDLQRISKLKLKMIEDLNNKN